MAVRTHRPRTGHGASRSAFPSAPRAYPVRPQAALAIALLLATLTACGSGGNAHSDPTVLPASPPPAAPALPSATPAPAPATPAPGFTSAAATAGEIVWASALDPATGAPLERPEAFSPDAPRIYAAVPVRHIEVGTRLRADWRYNDTPLESLASEATARETADDLWIAFELARGDGQAWPVGDYEVIVSIDGREALRSSTRVEQPADA